MLNLFMVEDSPMMRARLHAALSEIPGTDVNGFAETAEDAITEIRRRKPDVVLLDFRLRDGTGLEVLKEVKEQKPSPIVVVLTNLQNPKYREISLLNGADHFFHKATEFDAVLDLIRMLAQSEN